MNKSSFHSGLSAIALFMALGCVGSMDSPTAPTLGANAGSTKSEPFVDPVYASQPQARSETLNVGVATQEHKVSGNLQTRRVLIERDLFRDEYEQGSIKSTVHSYLVWSWKDWSWVLGRRQYAVTFHYDRQAFEDSKATGQSMPLVLFTGGMGNNSGDYATLISKIASKGYIVAAMEHAYIDRAVPIGDQVLSGSSTIFILDLEGFRYGAELAWLNPSSSSNELIYPKDPFHTYAVLEYEARDVKGFLDLLEQGQGDDAIAGELRGVMDLTRIAYAGHSMGGMTATLMACTSSSDAVKNEYYDGRIRAAISLDGGTYDHKTYTQAPFALSVPYLFLASDANWPGGGGNLEPWWLKGRLLTDKVMHLAGIENPGNRHVLEVLDSSHDSFLDDPVTTDVAAKYVDLFLREALQGQKRLSWELFYQDECNSNHPIISLKYTSLRPGWWYNELSLCAPGAILSIPGPATEVESYATVE